MHQTHWFFSDSSRPWCIAAAPIVPSDSSDPTQMLTVLATSKQRDRRIPAFIALILHMMTGPVMVSGLFLLTAPLTAGAVLILVSANLGTRKVSSNMLEIFPFVVGGLYLGAHAATAGDPSKVCVAGATWALLCNFPARQSTQSGFRSTSGAAKRLGPSVVLHLWNWTMI